MCLPVDKPSFISATKVSRKVTEFDLLLRLTPRSLASLAKAQSTWGRNRLKINWFGDEAASKSEVGASTIFRIQKGDIASRVLRNPYRHIWKGGTTGRR